MQQNSSREPKACFLPRTTDIADRNSDPLGFTMVAGNMQQANGLSTHDTPDRSFDQQQHSVRESPSHANKKAPPPNGKKTKGRVKIKMEFIDNKLRRYTTFSKRKTGIMKKAYELSTLTGTQVMLLVASETGHVYTFATRKLQPMITSEAGKALIQTCLNSPDPPAGPGCSGPDQRMSATGFEETELTYSVGDECERVFESPKSLFPSTSSLGDSSTLVPILPAPSATGGSVSPSTAITSLPLLTSLSTVTSSTTQTKTKSSSQSSTLPTISMQLPHATGFTTILAPAGTLSPALQIGTLQTSNQNSNIQQPTSQAQTVYRLPQVPLVSIPGTGKTQSPTSDTSTSSQNSISVVQGSQQGVSVVSGNMVIPASSAVLPNTSVSGAVMYQTPQGLVYATPTTLPEGVILNLGQENGGSPQQYITIPVSLSLTPAQQTQLLQSQSSSTLTQATNASMPAFPSSVINKKEKSKK